MQAPSPDGAIPAHIEAQVNEMCAAITHRGPDAQDTWMSPCGEVGLGHLRLAIVDLSAAGAQPMHSGNDRFTLVYNGEIYNHLDLRRQIEKVQPRLLWRGHSDTETLLVAISTWGLKEALRRAIGMFALALWDIETRVLSLARDRMGEKPLCYWHQRGRLAFASELRALETLPDLPRTPDPQALRGLVEAGAVPDNTVILAGLKKVRPGTIVAIQGPELRAETTIYEDFPALVRLGRERAAHGAPTDIQAIETVLGEVVGSQLLGDVPMGSFLSGGIDSSLITALMCAHSTTPVRTFSIGFSNVGYDESNHAEAVAEHLGTDHVTYRLTEDDALQAIPRLADVWDEPFADSSQLPTLLLCQKARTQVTVALTGDGGDEIFGGYNRHVAVPRMWQKLQRLPRPVRAMAPALAKVLQLAGGSGSNALRVLAQKAALPASVLDRAGRFAEVAAKATQLEDVYLALLRHTDRPEQFLCAPLAPRTPLPTFEDAANVELAEWMMFQDSLGYLASDILTKVDRAAMSVSLEIRAPFLDQRTVLAAWALPFQERIRGGRGKYVLRNILHRHVPEGLFDRPKQGFAIPLDSWLRGPLAAWVDTQFDTERLLDVGLLEPEAVQTLWASHRSGRGNHGALLWSLLMLQSWGTARHLTASRDRHRSA